MQKEEPNQKGDIIETERGGNVSTQGETSGGKIMEMNWACAVEENLIGE